MNTVKTYLLIVLSVTVIVLMLLLNSKPNVVTTHSTTVTTIKGDTIVITDTIKVPKPYAVESDPEIITLPVDSMLMSEYIKLKQAYTNKIIYIDTLKNDSNLFVSLIDTVYKNHLCKRLFNYENRKTTAIITNVTNTTIINNKGFLIGGSVGKNVLSPQILYLNNQLLFGGGYDLYNKTPIISLYYKLK